MKTGPLIITHIAYHGARLVRSMFTFDPNTKTLWTMQYLWLGVPICKLFRMIKRSSKTYTLFWSVQNVTIKVLLLGQQTGHRVQTGNRFLSSLRGSQKWCAAIRGESAWHSWQKHLRNGSGEHPAGLVSVEPGEGGWRLYKLYFAETRGNHCLRSPHAL